jgi:hypothetical protein
MLLLQDGVEIRAPVALLQGRDASTEARNPSEFRLDSFFERCRAGDSPHAEVEVGLAHTAAVILKNLAMDEERRIRFDEMAKLAPRPMGGDPLVRVPPKAQAKLTYRADRRQSPG